MYVNVWSTPKIYSAKFREHIKLAEDTTEMEFQSALR
jgi:hypothetical protein